jgi:hypothetical protein
MALYRHKGGTTAETGKRGSFRAGIKEEIQKRGDRVTVERIVYLGTAALVAMLLLSTTALAEEEEEFAPAEIDLEAVEQEAKVVEREVFERTPDEAIDEPGTPAPKEGTQSEEGTQPKGNPLPKSGGVMTSSALLLPVAALLLGAGLVGYALLRRRG